MPVDPNDFRAGNPADNSALRPALFQIGAPPDREPDQTDSVHVCIPVTDVRVVPQGHAIALFRNAELMTVWKMLVFNRQMFANAKI